ncbi:MAG: type II secretion system F family protein [Candidatus Margulisbacteria bacterium]|nr:type II secretion system F family protein [Candidatus Margulisiibacteriota bacterium]
MFSNLELAFFFKQLHYLVKRGISLYPAIELIYVDVGSKSLKKPLKIILNALKEGGNFSDILYEKIHIPLFLVNIIKVGENEGTMEHALAKASNYLESKIELWNKIQSALAYPIILVCLGVGILTWIMIAIIPQFELIYQQANVKLPLPTIIIFKLRHFFALYWWTIPLVIGSIILIIIMLLRDKLKYYLSQYVYSIPVIGTIAYYFTLMNFLSNLGSLHSSGIQLVKSMSLTLETTQNLYFKTKLKQVLPQVIEGKKLSIALWETKFFPAIVIKMIMAGEESSELDKILLQLTDYLNDELDNQLKKFVSLIGPISLIIIGFFVAFISLAFLLPLFRMTGVVHNVR